MTQNITKLSSIILLAILFFNTSCSGSDDDNSSSEPETSIKLKSFTDNFDTHEISYLENGKPQAIIAPNNTITNIVYDTMDRVIIFGSNDYTYDANGRLKTVTNEDGVCTFSYASNNLISAQNIVVSSHLGPNDILNVQRTFSYNGQNQMIEATETSNGIIGSDYKIMFTYNSLGQIVEAESAILVNDQYEISSVQEYLYSTTKNPKRLFYNTQIGFDGSFIPTIYSPLNHSFEPIDIGNFVHFRMYYMPEHTIALNTKTYFNSNGQTITTHEHNYQVDGDYPISATNAFSGFDLESTTSFLWEYINN